MANLGVYKPQSGNLAGGASMYATRNQGKAQHDLYDQAGAELGGYTTTLPSLAPMTALNQTERMNDTNTLLRNRQNDLSVRRFDAALDSPGAFPASTLARDLNVINRNRTNQEGLIRSGIVNKINSLADRRGYEQWQMDRADRQDQQAADDAFNRNALGWATLDMNRDRYADTSQTNQDKLDLGYNRLGETARANDLRNNLGLARMDLGQRQLDQKTQSAADNLRARYHLADERGKDALIRGFMASYTPSGKAPAERQQDLMNNYQRIKATLDAEQGPDGAPTTNTLARRPSLVPPVTNTLATRPMPNAGATGTNTLSLATPPPAFPPAVQTGPSLASRPMSMDVPQDVNNMVYTGEGYGTAGTPSLAAPRSSQISLEPQPEVYDFTPTLAQRSANDTDRMQRLNAGTNASVNRYPDPEEQKLMNAVAPGGSLARQNAVRESAGGVSPKSDNPYIPEKPTVGGLMPRPGRADNTLSLADLAGSTRTIQLRNLTPQQQQELTALKARFPGRDTEIENTYLNNL